MTLEEVLQQKVANWRPPEGRHDLIVAEEGPGWTVTLTADRCDELGCLLWELKLQRSPAASARAVTLQDWADGIAARVTGLLEPLKVVEVDVLQNVALLRSSTATPRGDKLYYYEVRLHGTREADVCRYAARQSNAGPREQVSFALTHETLIKFIGDVCADK